MVPMEAGLHGVGTGEMKQEVKQKERKSLEWPLEKC